MHPHYSERQVVAAFTKFSIFRENKSNSGATSCFIDFAAAFDSLDREPLRWMMKSVGVANKLFQIIQTPVNIGLGSLITPTDQTEKEFESSMGRAKADLIHPQACLC